jgi:recombinational DNA repair ATPase RecF
LIKIEELCIREFRGIRDLTLKFNGRSFVIWGPNGSGKSGVVDAIDFVLTGSVSRLSGAGSGGVTLTRHGPHVHHRDDPGAAQVQMRVRDTASGETAVLTRCVRTAKQYSLEPDSPGMRAAVDMAGEHPELILSRREIIRYIVAEPGKRSVEIQALLKLDRFGEIRSVLRTVQTKTGSAETSARSQMGAAEDALRRHLDLTTLLATEVTAVVNKHRGVLGVDPLSLVDQDSDLRQGIDADSPQSPFNKVSAVRDVTALIEMMSDPSAYLSAVEALTEVIDELEADPEILTTLRGRDLVTTGLALLEDEHCPLCDLEWPDVAALRAHLTGKLKKSEEAVKLQELIRQRAQAVVAASKAVRGLAAAAESVAAEQGATDVRDAVASWATQQLALENDLASIEGIRTRRIRLTDDPLGVPNHLTAGVASLLASLRDKPDQTATADARTFLIIAQERWTTLRLARADVQKTAKAHLAAQAIYEIWCEEQDTALTALYDNVEAEFSSFYRELNSDDESAFKAELEPSAGKLELSVDFHSLGMFPPAAYHSEGHQDGMGVCLYLALVRQLLGTDLQFVVLDDVVMSVDTNHRRQFCNLLKARFPDVQFIITTHDAVWARQMQTSGLIAKAAQARFLHWTVDAGPALEEGEDFWDKIGSDLEDDDVSAAAARLRRNLEANLADLADALSGQVTYRADGNYELSDFLSAVKGRYGKLLGQAAKAANAYNNEPAKAEVEALQGRRAEAVLAQEGEQWALNPAVHFNDWANFSKADFEPVVDTWRQFLGLFRCDTPGCESWIYVVGGPGREEALRCNCGRLNLSLRGK